jgi:hypothetical protein
MINNDQNDTSVVDPSGTAPVAPGFDPGIPEADHPHAGIAEEGWSSPQSEPAGRCSTFGKLVLKRGGMETDIEFPLQAPAIVGRFDPSVGPIDVDLGSLPEGVYVSRKHAKISCGDDGWTIQDLGSSNGTFVLRDDFEKIDEAPLMDGAEIAFGNARFVFHETASMASPTEADPQS